MKTPTTRIAALILLLTAGPFASADTLNGDSNVTGSLDIEGPLLQLGSFDPSTPLFSINSTLVSNVTFQTNLAKLVDSGGGISAQWRWESTIPSTPGTFTGMDLVLVPEEGYSSLYVNGDIVAANEIFILGGDPVIGMSWLPTIISEPQLGNLTFSNNINHSITIQQSGSGTAGRTLSVAAGAASGTNLAGGSLVLSAGSSTGTAGSTIELQTAVGGTSGSTVRPAQTRLKIESNGTVTINGALTVGGSVSLTSPLASGSGGTGMNNAALAADRFLYTSATGTFSSATVSSYGRSLLANANATAARSTLGAAAQSDIPLFWKYAIETQNTSYNPGSEPINSTGSGVTYWPGQDHLLLLDNTVRTIGGNTGAVLHEFSRAGTWIRRIHLKGFNDPEDIHWISGNTFVISQEYHDSPASVDELVVVNLPTGSTNTLIDIASGTDVVRRLTINTSTFQSVNNTGIEGVSIVGNDFYFTTEKAPATGEWNVWKVANTGSSATVTPTKVFPIRPLINGRATDISGMASDGTYLWFLSDEGLSATLVKGRIIKSTVDGRFIEENVLPYFTGGLAWLQAEAIGLFVESNIPKIILTGEDTGGVDLMILALQ
jgi:uncharacterized protein YjiK